jgi:hypothetical protein
MAVTTMTLLDLLRGYQVSQALAVAAVLGLADHLRAGPQTSAQLADATGTHAPSLARLLRARASLGVVTEDPDGRFRLMLLGALLQTEGAESLRAYAIMQGEAAYQAWGGLLSSIQTGQRQMDFYAALDQQPEAAARFQAVMAQSARQTRTAVLSVYDFAPFRTIVDVGGGYGVLLAAILQADPQTCGILFDKAAVVAAAAAHLAAAGLTERCTVVGGNFLEAVPSGGDLYLLSWILAGHDDAEARTILHHCYAAMHAEGTLLLRDYIRPPEPVSLASAFFDLHMLVILGGAVRSEAEWRALLHATGFALTRILPLQPPFSVLEGRRVPGGARDA